MLRFPQSTTQSGESHRVDSAADGEAFSSCQQFRCVSLIAGTKVHNDIPTCGFADSPNHVCGRRDPSSPGVSAVALHKTCVGLNISSLHIVFP